MSSKGSNPSQPLTLAAHLRNMRKQFPSIRPFLEEDDIHWYDNGQDAIAANRLDLAERFFKKLILAQPKHFDGYFGLARVFQRLRRPRPAILFADEAIRLAQPFLEDGSLDPAKLEVLRQFRSQLDASAGTTTPQQKSRLD